MRWSVIVFVLMLTACSTADLRPESARESGFASDARADGERMLDELARAHGGRQAWLKAETLVVEMRDEWGSFMFALAGPWPDNGTPFRLTYLTGQDDGRITFLEADEPDWGIQNWKTYTVPEGGEPIFEADDDIEFWIPTTAYFIEAPFRLSEATTVYALEPKKVGGKTFERVFLTWGDPAPQELVDQYIAWIDRETKQLKWLEYTIRDMGDWMAGCMEYTDYARVDGFLLARTMTTVDEPGGEPSLHRFVVESYEVRADVERSYVIPRPELSASKH